MAAVRSVADLPADVIRKVLDEAELIPGVNFFIAVARNGRLEIQLADHGDPTQQRFNIDPFHAQLARFPPISVSSHYGRLSLSRAHPWVHDHMRRASFRHVTYCPADAQGNRTFISPDDLAYIQFGDEAAPSAPPMASYRMPRPGSLTEGQTLDLSPVRGITKVAIELNWELNGNCIWANPDLWADPGVQAEQAMMGLDMCMSCLDPEDAHLGMAKIAPYRFAAALRSFPDLQKVYVVGSRNRWISEEVDDKRIPENAWRYVAKGQPRLNKPNRWVKAVGEKFYVGFPNSSLVENSAGQVQPSRGYVNTRVLDHIQRWFVDPALPFARDTGKTPAVLAAEESERRNVEFRMMHWIEDKNGLDD